MDSIWAEHGAWDVSNYCYRSYDNAIRTMFGDPKTAKEYADNAQFLNADGYRAMFEAANSPDVGYYFRCDDLED